MNETMNAVEDLRHRLALLGACEMADGISDIRGAVDMLFTPQGREFAVNTGFPSLEFLLKHRQELSVIHCIHTDCNNLSFTLDDKCPNMFIFGDSQAVIHVSKPTTLYRIIVAHNAKIKVDASEYAVVTIAKVGDAEIEIINDGTAVVTMEE